MLPILNCDNCGACCMEQESPPGYLIILSFGDEAAFSAADLARYKAMPPEALTQLKTYAEHLREHQSHPNDGICIWFNEETRKCNHYDLRPDVCRTEVECGDYSCLNWRDYYDVK